MASSPTYQEPEVHYNIPMEEALHKVSSMEALDIRTNPYLGVEEIVLRKLNYKIELLH